MVAEHRVSSSWFVSVRPSRRQLLLGAGLGLLAPWGRAASGPGVAVPPLVVTLRSPDSQTDQRNAFAREAVQLALQRTVASHGPFVLRQSQPMTKLRALRVASQQQLPHFLLMSGPEAARAAGLVPVPFPLLMGVNRYRVCFVSTPVQAQVRDAAGLAELARLRHVQGRGWADVGILRANGFQVTEVNNYAGMFQMLALGRADLFCRSVLEVGPEVRNHAGQRGLALDDSFMLQYELPQYLYTHPSHGALVARLSQGLRLAYADGQLQALMQRHLKPWRGLLALERRKLYRLQAPPALSEMDDRPYQMDLSALAAGR